MYKPIQTRLLLSAIATLMGICCGGCGPSNYPEVGLVNGTITIGGQPLSNAQVVFAPETGRPSMGTTDTSGQYQLTYIRDVKGAIPGMHKVSISTLQASTSDRDGRPTKETIPARYNMATTLTAEVIPGDNTVDFVLERR